jgi:hypothetical protein
MAALGFTSRASSTNMLYLPPAALTWHDKRALWIFPFFNNNIIIII